MCPQTATGNTTYTATAAAAGGFCFFDGDRGNKKARGRLDWKRKVAKIEFVRYGRYSLPPTLAKVLCFMGARYENRRVFRCKHVFFPSPSKDITLQMKFRGRGIDGREPRVEVSRCTMKKRLRTNKSIEKSCCEFSRRRHCKEKRAAPTRSFQKENFHNSALVLLVGVRSAAAESV